MTESADKCPRCGDHRIAHGKIWHGFNQGFRPEDIKWFALSIHKADVRVNHDYTACTACGLLGARSTSDRLMAEDSRPR